MPQQSPLLDDYNNSGIVTPALQKALDIARQKLPQFQLPQTTSAPGATPRFTLPGSEVPSISRTPNPTASASPLTMPRELPAVSLAERSEAPIPTLTAPSAGSAAPRITDAQDASDLTELNRRKNTGSGLDQLGNRIDQIKNPWLRGVSRVGQGLLRAADITGSAFVPRITAGIPGTELHHNYLVNRAEGTVDKDVARAKEKASTEESEALTQKNLQGQIPTNDLELWAKQNPGKPVEEFLRLKRENAPERNETPFDVWRKQNPGAAPEEWLKAEENTKYHAPNEYEDFKTGYLKSNPQAGAEEIVSKYAAAHQAPQRTPQNEYEDFKTGYLKAHPSADAFEVTREYAKAHQSPEHPPQALMLVPDGNGGYTTTLVKPGEHVDKGAVTPNQAGSVNTPTTQMRNVAAQAQLVHEQTPYMLSEIDRLKDKLGPMTGRWNEVMQGKLGLQDPDFAGLRADLLMYSSAVALMHARGRLPENLREEFDRTINNPGQDFKNLKTVISKIDAWTVKNPGVKDDTGANGLPGGISLEDINAEIERRKKK